MQSSGPSIGIDFGTTNSSIAILSGGTLELLRFPSVAGLTESYRSVLYLEQIKHTGRSQLKSFTGPRAIEHYLHAESPGRLIQSLKSYLPSRSLTGTEAFGRRYTLEELIARILTDLRLAIEAHIGGPVRHATVGRPVRFVAAETPEDDAFAVGRLEAAFKLAGFDSVDFEFEPIGAAFAYESTLQRDELILIGDFGGGTSDFSLLHVGPGVRARGRTPCSATPASASPAMPSTPASFAASSRRPSAPTPSNAPSPTPPTAPHPSSRQSPRGSTPISNAGTTSLSSRPAM
jgi:hypothetical chaperone protein